jgi:hypothetical protein
MLTAIKILHTVIWVILAGGVMVLPVAGILRRFHWAAILIGLVLLEYIVLALNGADAHCPTLGQHSPLTAPTTSISSFRAG